MSRPSTPDGQLGALLALVGFAGGGGFQRLGGHGGAARTTTPSSSATITSPGFTSAPAQTTGMLTEPRVALIVPLELIALLHTGKPISVSVFTSRTPASMTSAAGAARLERGGQQVAEDSRRCIRR